ncbi:MAG: TolC family protein [Thermodesulfobacteriota bacterium]
MTPAGVKTLVSFLSLLIFTIISASPEARGVNIGIVFDGPSDLNYRVLEAYKKEIGDLTEGEFTVLFPEDKIITSDWTSAGVKAAIERQLSDPGVDILITLGIIGSTEAAGRTAFPKPVIAPWVIDPVLMGLTPAEGGGSGVGNLYYLSRPVTIGRDIKRFRDIVGFKRMALLYMPLMTELIPALENSVKKISAENDIIIELVPARASVAESLSAIPADAEAVFVSPIINYTGSQMAELYDGLIEKNLPSFSMMGKREVETGALIGLTPEHNITREARRVALVVQSILLGDQAGDFPVEFSEEELLTVNMATARAIKFSPSWSILTEASLINEEPAEKGRTLTLEQAVNESVEVNLDLLAADQFVAAGAQDIRLAMAELLPQSDIFAANTYIDKDRAEASLGTQPQRDISVGGNVSQLIYSERAWSNLTVQKRLQESREFTRDEVRLDIIAATAIGYLNVLRAKTIERIQKENLKLTKSNLEIAKVRRDIGVASPAEVYRWESQISSDRIDVVNSEADRKNTEILVNRLLHRPQGEEYTTVETGLEDPSLLVSDPRLEKYVDNPESFKVFMDFMVNLGLKLSPAIAAIDSEIAAQDRILTSTKRAFWSPTIFAFGELRQFLYEGGAGSDVNIPPDFPIDIATADDTEWTVQIQASFPLFRGGAKIADYKKARSELSRLRYERDSTAEKVEEQIRTSLNASGASYPSIGFALDAAEAAHKNLELVTDSYSRGVVSILDLLDAQNAALSADLNAANSVYNFLIDLMNVQRASGRFDFFTSPQERDELFRMLDDFYNKPAETDNKTDAGPAGPPEE